MVFRYRYIVNIRLIYKWNNLNRNLLYPFDEKIHPIKFANPGKGDALTDVFFLYSNYRLNYGNSNENIGSINCNEIGCELHS